MPAPRIPEPRLAEIASELAYALDEMVDVTCQDMAPLWLDATHRERAFLDDRVHGALGFEPSARYRGLSKGAKSKYRGLAAWRHAVVWRGVIDRIEDPAFRGAMVSIYFSPYPKNEPPYSWSSSAADAPGAARAGGPRELKKLAKEGCFVALMDLRRVRAELQEGQDEESRHLSELLKAATRKSLVDELKLEDHDLGSLR